MQGNPGATGATGATGPTGATGAQGPAGFSTVSRPTADFTATQGTWTSGSVNCPGSQPRVVGGGAEVKDNPGNPNTRNQGTVVFSHPSSGGNGWVVRVRNDGCCLGLPTTVYAICV